MLTPNDESVRHEQSVAAAAILAEVRRYEATSPSQHGFSADEARYNCDQTPMRRSILVEDFLSPGRNELICELMSSMPQGDVLNKKTELRVLGLTRSCIAHPS